MAAGQGARASAGPGASVSAFVHGVLRAEEEEAEEQARAEGDDAAMHEMIAEARLALIQGRSDDLNENPEARELLMGGLLRSRSSRGNIGQRRGSVQHD